MTGLGYGHFLEVQKIYLEALNGTAGPKLGTLAAWPTARISQDSLFWAPGPQTGGPRPSTEDLKALSRG